MAACSFRLLCCWCGRLIIWHWWTRSYIFRTVKWRFSSLRSLHLRLVILYELDVELWCDQSTFWLSLRPLLAGPTIWDIAKAICWIWFSNWMGGAGHWRDPCVIPSSNLNLFWSYDLWGYVLLDELLLLTVLWRRSYWRSTLHGPVVHVHRGLLSGCVAACSLVNNLTLYERFCNISVFVHPKRRADWD